MPEEIDGFVKDLQGEIIEDTIKAYGQRGFERWRNPLYMKPMDNPDGYGCITGPCGDTMQIYLKFEDGIVKEASFQTDGCGSSMICGSFAAELALGKKPAELQDIKEETIIKTIGRLPEEDRHCALLAANTLLKAVSDYEKRSGENKKR